VVIEFNHQGVPSNYEGGFADWGSFMATYTVPQANHTYFAQLDVPQVSLAL
jgi:hypothetical protein